MELNNLNNFRYLIIFCIVLMVIFTEVVFKDYYKEWESQIGTLVVSLVIVLICLGYQYKVNNVGDLMNPTTALIIIVLLSSYIQLMMVSQANNTDECSSNDEMNPITKALIYNDNFSDTQKGKERFVYSIFYGILLIIVLLTILNLQDSKSDTLENLFKPNIFFGRINLSPFTDKKNLTLLIYAFPLLLPLLTESITGLFNWLGGSVISNESAFIQFILGRSGEDIEGFEEWSHLIITALFVLSFVIYILLHSGLVPNFFKTPLTETAIGLILLLLICFPIVMRMVFLQKCSREELDDEEKNRDIYFNCSISKYGGFLLLFIITLIIMFLHSVKITEVKTFYFFIILFGGVAGGFILHTLKPLN